MNIQQAKLALDKVINKSRVHLYKPIHIAEVLHRDRVFKDINLSELESYRIDSKRWRDEICLKLIGRVSNSSAKYQDDIFNETAIPPKLLALLGEENRNKNGIVEAYIYQKFAHKHSQMSNALEYCDKNDKNNFQLSKFISLFWHEAGLKRSIDKVYEIIVFALFSSIVQALELSIEVSYNSNKTEILVEFQDFAQKVLNLSPSINHFKTPANVFRVGVTNAADRGLDMWANFGLAIQIKHLSLDEEKAEEIVNSINADRIVIVCKEAEQKIILSLLNQIGWKSKIQSIVTEKELLNWYENALRGKYAPILGDNILNILKQEIVKEFPITQNSTFINFYNGRNYHTLFDNFWVIKDN
jgi:type II restriction enzyme